MVSIFSIQAPKSNSAGTDIDNSGEANVSQVKFSPEYVHMKEESSKLTGHDPKLRKDKFGFSLKDRSQNMNLAIDANDGTVVLESQKEQAFSSQKSVSDPFRRSYIELHDLFILMHFECKIIYSLRFRFLKLLSSC